MKTAWLFRLGLILFLSWLKVCGAAPQTIRVGAYPFPPYLDQNQGATPRLLALLNRSQDQWRFVLVRTAARRRHLELESGVFDMMMFENPSWGWDAKRTRIGHPLLRDAELFIARAAPGRDQSFFAAPHPRVATLGFHYGFMGQRAVTGTEAGLRFVAKPELVLEQVLNAESEQGVITRSYLAQRLAVEPQLAKQLLIGDREDCTYLLGPVFSPASPLSPEEFERLLGRVAGQWKSFLVRERLTAVE